MVYMDQILHTYAFFLIGREKDEEIILVTPVVRQAVGLPENVLDHSVTMFGIYTRAIYLYLLYLGSSD